MSILAWLILGLIAGALAKAVIPGDQKGGCILTSLLGVVGAVVGGWVGTLLGFGSVTEFDFRSLFVAFIGSLIVLLILRAVSRG